MKYTIHKWKHRAWPFTFGLFYDKKEFIRDVYFDNSCKYHLDEMDDTNKIFGLGYFWDHHKYSARFGWRYNPNTGLIVLSAYVYDRGERTITDLCEVQCFAWYRLRISINDNKYSFQVWDRFSGWKTLGFTYTAKTHSKKWSYRLGFFFGGQAKSPQKMFIEIK